MTYQHYDKCTLAKKIHKGNVRLIWARMRTELVTVLIKNVRDIVGIGYRDISKQLLVA